MPIAHVRPLSRRHSRPKGLQAVKVSNTIGRATWIVTMARFPPGTQRGLAFFGGAEPTTAAAAAGDDDDIEGSPVGSSKL